MSSTGASLMARPKASKGKPDDEKPAAAMKVVGLKASPAWSDWLERAADHSRTTVAGFLDRAAASLAKSEGFDELPPKRVP